MVSDNRSLINLALVLLGFLGWLTTYLLFELLAGHFSPVARAWGNQTVHHLIPIALGVAVFTVLRMSSKTVTFTDDVIAELKRVTWPEPEMTWGLTWRVCIILMLAGVIVSGYDFVWAYIIKLIVKG